MMTSKKANDFLATENRDMQSLFAKIRILADINTRMMPLLPAELKDYCQVANLIQDQLIIITANGSVATQLRFQNLELLRKMKSDPILEKIKSLQFKVHPGFSSSNTKKSANKPSQIEKLSPETAEMIKQAAESLADPKLKEVMERIAKHVDTTRK